MAYSAEVYVPCSGFGWRMKEYNEVNQYVSTGAGLFWQVTPVYCFIEVC